MNDFFYNFLLVLVSFLGIGFISRLREVLTSILAITIVWILPDSDKTIVLIILIIFFITFFVIFIRIYPNRIDKGKLISIRAIGIWIACLSPFVLFNLMWVLITLSVYWLSLMSLSSFAIIRRNENGQVSMLLTEISAGVLTLVSVQILYTAFNLAPVIYIFLTK